MPYERPENSGYAFLSGGGEMGELIRSLDWSLTGLGAPGTWPVSLKQMVSMMLTTRLPVLICWGKDYIQLYNDAFHPINGADKHPKAMGGTACDTYAEIWGTIGAMFEEVMTGKSLGFPDFMVQLERNGSLEDCYFDFSYSPITDEYGHTGGVLVICMETTGKVNAISEFQALNEELAAVNEELAASNEEYAATNEELASVNEELATTNEELKETQENLHGTNRELLESGLRLRTALDTIIRSEKLFRSIAVNIPNSLILVIDKEHRYQLVDGDLMEKLGYQKADYEGKHPTEIGQTERYLASKHLYDRMMDGEKFSIERKAVTGEYYIAHFVPIKNEHEEIDAGLVMVLDVTDIKKGQEESAKLAAIIDSSDDAIISKTFESVITSWNDSAERMFGYTADEIIGETIYKIIPPDRYDEEPGIISRIKNGERVEHYETKRVTKDGRLLDVSLTVSPVKDKQGNIIGISKIARDITEKKLDETRKNDFIGIVSHELKTPLTSLTAMVQLLNSRLKNHEDPFVPNLLAKANIQVKKMNTMINGFLNIARLESGKIQLDKKDFDLTRLVNDIIDETKLISAGYTINSLSCNPIMVNADEDKIGSVITNLLSNAVKYSEKGTTIEVLCEIEGDVAQVSVKDEGPGIREEDIEYLFDRFFRVEDPGASHVSGFGIGLYLSAEIVHRHNGIIRAESEIGKGSVFRFSLPYK